MRKIGAEHVSPQEMEKQGADARVGNILKGHESNRRRDTAGFDKTWDELTVTYRSSKPCEPPHILQKHGVRLAEDLVVPPGKEARFPSGIERRTNLRVVKLASWLHVNNPLASVCEPEKKIRDMRMLDRTTQEMQPKWLRTHRPHIGVKVEKQKPTQLQSAFVRNESPRGRAPV